MGCWNETCALTRFPIFEGQPVVALETFSGPDFSCDVGFSQALRFGLHYRGAYDGYGRVEGVTQPEQRKFADAAFTKAAVYRNIEHSGRTRWVANNSKIFMTTSRLASKLESFFYPPGSVKPSQLLASDNSEVSKSARAAQADALKIFEQKFPSLGALQSVPEFEDALFELLLEMVGPASALPALSVLKSEGLYGHRTPVLMHANAFDTLVREFSSRAVSLDNPVAGGRKRLELREFCSQELDLWYANFEKSMVLWTTPVPGFEQSDEVRWSRALRMTTSSPYLEPSTKLWFGPRVPLYGHFWGGAMPAEVLAAHSRGTILDHVVFEWALNYLRISLRPSNGGGQGEETILPAQIYDATVSALKEDRKWRTERYMSGVTRFQGDI